MHVIGSSWPLCSVVSAWEGHGSECVIIALDRMISMYILTWLRRERQELLLIQSWESISNSGGPKDSSGLPLAGANDYSMATEAE